MREAEDTRRLKPYAGSALSVGIALAFAAGCGPASGPEERDVPNGVIGGPLAQVWACTTLRDWEGKAKSDGCEIVESGTTVKLLDEIPPLSRGFGSYALIEYETTAGQTKRGYVLRIGVQIEKPVPQPPE